MSAPANEVLNPLAKELNEKIAAAASEILAMLSPLGRRLYFPKGILTQGAEARVKGTRFNATIGIATEGKAPMYLPSLHKHLTGVSPDDAYNYAPAAGKQALRERWREKQLAENPAQRGLARSRRVVVGLLGRDP